MADAVLRFCLGGLVVSLFATAGELFAPKRFAGIFGAAPSVALGTLALAFLREGTSYVVTESRGMVIGAFALLAYSAFCVSIAEKPRVPVWLGAVFGWLFWLGVAACGYLVACELAALA